MEPPENPPKKIKKKGINHVSVRKRLTRNKRHVKPRQESVSSEGSDDHMPAAASDQPEVRDLDHDINFGNGATSTTNETNLPQYEPVPSPSSSCHSLSDHDYCSASPRPSSSLSRPGSSLSHISDVSNISGTLSISLSDVSLDASSSSNLFSPNSPVPINLWHSEHNTEPVTMPQCDKTQDTGEELQALMLEARQKLFLMLPQTCLPIVDKDSIHVVMIGRRTSKAIQRQVTVSLSGDVHVEVHGVDYPTHSILSGVRSQQPLTSETCGYFVDRIVEVISNLRLLEICSGMDQQEFREAWPFTDQGVIETDVFKECRYTETFRSKKCSLLVSSKHWRCKECTKLTPILKRKLQLMNCDEPPENTNHRFLIGKQKDILLKKKQKTIVNQKQTIKRLHAKIKQMIENDGVKIEPNMSNDLTQIMQSADLKPNQLLFWQQQLKAAQCKNSCGMRWHPTLIRMALSLYLKAPGAYEELCESGFIKLPTSRTLFDYSHVTKVEPGVDSSVVESVAKRVNIIEEDRSQPQYHVVMVDEMHISKNLVLLKSTGELIGFKDLDVLDEELAALEAHLSDPDKPLEQQLASKVMAFMVKGVSSNLKHVVASYPVCNPSPRQMYMWTWDVVGAMERNGVKVIAIVCDGASTNRAFIKLHKPATITTSGVIFDTVNKFAPDRLIYFFSDVPHLLKTTRNAFFNSRRNPKNKKKSPRLLKKNGELIVWDTVIRLYLAKKDLILRKSYKLNAQNVFPDSYSRMKVKAAAEVMSHTVATDIRGQGWPGTSETVEFLLKVNNWFDLLNGAFSTQGFRTNNTRLHPYTLQDVKDFEEGVKGSRFQELLDFLKYLDDWREEVQAKINDTLRSAMSGLGVEPLADEDSFHALNDSQQDEGADQEEDASSKNLLPHQTQLGIEMSSRAFIGATTFLLNNGVAFINARVFCQDPLEQNFGRQRMAGGGSNNPNLSQFLHKQRGFSTIGELSATNKRGNTEVLKEDVDISSEKLPKRKRT